jgi:probable rRNA maturation factor
MTRMTTLSLSSTVRSYPDFPYETIKNAILGKTYHLSLTFVGQTRAQKLNITTRNKDYIPNVLSFPLDATAGEIYICPEVAKKQAKDFDLSAEGYIAYLFIHGCVHLKGHDHGDTMDKMERAYLKKFRIS